MNGYSIRDGDRLFSAISDELPVRQCLVLHVKHPISYSKLSLIITPFRSIVIGNVAINRQVAYSNIKSLFNLVCFGVYYKHFRRNVIVITPGGNIQISILIGL
ncbi:hypothetical protein D3C86_1454310 [compost metagenome]